MNDQSDEDYAAGYQHKICKWLSDQSHQSFSLSDCKDAFMYVSPKFLFLACDQLCQQGKLIKDKSTRVISYTVNIDEIKRMFPVICDDTLDSKGKAVVHTDNMKRKIAVDTDATNVMRQKPTKPNTTKLSTSSIDSTNDHQSMKPKGLQVPAKSVHTSNTNKTQLQQSRNLVNPSSQQQNQENISNFYRPSSFEVEELCIKSSPAGFPSVRDASNGVDGNAIDQIRAMEVKFRGILGTAKDLYGEEFSIEAFLAMSKSELKSEFSQDLFDKSLASFEKSNLIMTDEGTIYCI